MSVLGVVLAGGTARRFGSDKALASWRGRPLLDHAVDLVAQHADAVAIAGGMRAGYASLADCPAPGLGPLGGVCGALAHARDAGFAAVLTIPCDTPDLPYSLLAALRAAHPPACLAPLPVAGVWPTTLYPALRDWLTDGDDRSVRGWARACGATWIESNVPIRNVNRPADLA